MSTILDQGLFLAAVDPDGSNFVDYSAFTLPSAVDPTESPFEAVEVVGAGPILAVTLFGMVSPNPTTPAQAGVAVQASPGRARHRARRDRGDGAAAGRDVHAARGRRRVCAVAVGVEADRVLGR